MPDVYLKERPNWTSKEIIIYKSQKSGLPFQSMSSKQQDVFVSGIMYKIAVISGCQLPADQRHLETLESEMNKFLSQTNSFAGMTFEEILMAFRFNAACQLDEKVEHYNNIFNLDYLGKVLSKWAKYSNGVKRKARHEMLVKNLLEPVVDPVKLSDAAVVKNAEKIWKETRDILFIPFRAFDILWKKGVMNFSEEEEETIHKEAREKEHELYSTEPDSYYLMPEKKLRVRLAKKISIAKYFEQEKVD